MIDKVAVISCCRIFDMTETTDKAVGDRGCIAQNPRILKLSLIVLVGLWFFLSPGPVAARNKPWIEVNSPHFRVLSNGSKSRAREVAFDLEQLRYVFANEFPKVRLDTGAPLLVFAARDEKSVLSLLPSLKKVRNGRYVAGEYFGGWEKQYAMILLGEPDADHVVYHEYVHSILHMNVTWLPSWLAEGLEEFYAYTLFENHKIYLGGPSRIAPMLRNNSLIPIKKLMSAHPTSPASFSGILRIGMFYAESWALVHFMMFGPGMQGGSRLAHFVSLLASGEDQETAFQQVFGGFKKMNAALQQYAMRHAFETAVLSTPPTINQKTFTERVLTLPETDAQLAAFHVWTHDMHDAAPLAQAAIRLNPKLGLAHEDMGYVLFSQGKDAAAEKEFSRAYSLDRSLYLSLFAKTMLSPIAASSSPEAQSQFRGALQKVVQLDPKLPSAYVQLALLAVRQNNLPQALQYSRCAEALAPGRAEYHLLTGRILLRMGRGAQAARIAKFVAARWRGTDHDEAVALWDRVPAAQRPAGKALSLSVPAGLRVASGTIQSEQCSDGHAKYQIVIQSGGRLLTFRAAKRFEYGFSDTLWYGVDHFTLCHNLNGLHAVVFFHPTSRAGSDGKIAVLEIRDTFPARKPGATKVAGQHAVK